MNRQVSFWAAPVMVTACALGAFAPWAPLALAAPASAFGTVGVGGDEVIAEFSRHLAELDGVTETARTEIEALLKAAGDDPYSQAEALTASLTLLYPEYERALMESTEDDPDATLQALRSQAQAGDEFLAADASFFLARTLMSADRHEEAIAFLERINGELAGNTLHSGTALYFTGVAHANVLENQRAVTAFQTFLDQYPEAPERLRISAWHQLQTLAMLEEGSLGDVLQRMEYSRRRLQIENTDEATQDQQEKIVAMLQTMIVEAQKKECSGSCSKKNSDNKSESQQQKQAQNQSPGQSQAGGSSSNPNGVAQKSYDNGPASPWSRLRDRTRDAANNAVKEKLPARYRSVVEKYYERISGGDDWND